MATRQISDSEVFKRQDAASYDLLTASFDRYTALYTTPLAQRMVAAAALRTGQSVLDVGTGTGIVALEAAKIVGRNGSVTGIDLSDPMMAAAGEKARVMGLSFCIKFQNMDAERMTFLDSSFDGVLSLFAILHFPDPQAAVREMYRVLRPGGTLVVAVGSGPPLWTLEGWIHRASRSRDIWPLLRGRLLLAPRSLDAFIREEIPRGEMPEESDMAKNNPNRSGRLRSLVEMAGFADVRSFWIGRQEEIRDPEDYWELQRTYSSFSRKRLCSAAPSVADRVHRRYVDRCRRVQDGGGKLMYHHAAMFVQATRPAC